MSNGYYNYTSGIPVAISRGVSSQFRAEFTLIAAGFDSVATQFNGLAPLASPTFTGTPSGPTAAPGTSTTQFATTAFVATSYAPLASPSFTGTPTVPTPSVGDNSSIVANTAWVRNFAFSLTIPNSVSWAAYQTFLSNWGGINSSNS